MDPLKARLFIKDLIYDLNTVRILLDHDRTRETLPIIGRILDAIDVFRGSRGDQGSDGLFDEKYWDKKLPAGMTFLEMRTRLSGYAAMKTPEKELDSIGYLAFVENVHHWSESNISRIRLEIKSPWRRKAEKAAAYCAMVIIGSCLLGFLYGIFLARNCGLYGQFYKGMNFEQKISSGTNKTIDFDDYTQMKSGIPAEMFSARWSGYLLVDKDLPYTFYLFIDDGGRLFIDGKPVIDQWQNHPGVEFQNKLFLARGKHAIRVDYYNDHYRSMLKLYWEPEGGKKEIIPASHLRMSL